MNRTPPQNTEAEAAILGACMSYEQAVTVAMQEIKSDDFYSPANRVIFSSICDLFRSGSPVDMVSTINRIMEQGKIHQAGSANYVSGLTQSSIGWRNTAHNCRIVKDKAMARRAIEMATNMAERCYAGEPMRDIMDDFSMGFSSLSGLERGKSETLAEITPRVMDKIRRISEDGESYGIPTGFVDLDRRLTGLARQDLVVIAARPAMGKTVLAVDIALNVAAQGKRVLLFSLEMSKEQICTRMLSSKSSVSGDSIRNGYLNESTTPRLHAARGFLDSLPVSIIDNPGLGITDIRSMAKMQHMQSPVGMVVVDYMQLSKAAAGKNGNREREISMISSGMKEMAKELDAPVVALSQLNRGLESRTDKRPMLSDLRESGAIEQDADVVLFIYRDEVYNTAEDNPNKGIAEIITAKQRNGSTGKDRLLFQGEFSRFQNLVM